MSVDKLVDSAQLNSDLTSVANAIRTKGGTSASLAFPADFVSAINAISGGGGISIDDIATNTQPSGAIVLGSGVTTIADRALQNKPITSISGANVTDIKTDSLDGTRITSITDTDFPKLGVGSLYRVLLRLPSTCTAIKLSGAYISLSSGSYALRNCTGLVTAEFPNAAKSVGASYKGMGQYCFGGCTALQMADIGFVTSIAANAFNGDTNFDTLVIRSTSVVSLSNVNAFSGTKFKNGGAGGTIYIPKSLYDALGTGTNDYKAASNWSTVNGYGTITWAKIEGSIYE